jgi:hypothetical protein
MEIDAQLEQQEQVQEERKEKEMETKQYTHMISCEIELEWVKELADLIGVKHEQYDLLMDEETFQNLKGWKHSKWKTLAKKTGYSYDWKEVHILNCLHFEGKILSPEEKAYKEKVLVISNMNGDALLKHIRSLEMRNVYAMKSDGGSDVVDIHLYANTDVVAIQEILFNECIPFIISPSGKRIECSGKLNRIKREHEQLRLSNANRPWFPVDRSIRDSF